MVSKLGLRIVGLSASIRVAGLCFDCGLRGAAASWLQWQLRRYGMLSSGRILPRRSLCQFLASLMRLNWRGLEQGTNKQQKESITTDYLDSTRMPKKKRQ